MNYSEYEHSGNRTEDDALIEAGMQLLPLLGPALFGGISQVAHAHNLTPAQMKVILQVGLRGQMTMGEIACGLTVSMPATSEIVDRLVESGHLTRSSDPHDRRRVLITPTAESLRINEEMNALRRAQLERAFGQLMPPERPVFVRALQALLHGLTSDGDATTAPCADDRAANPVQFRGGAASASAHDHIHQDRDNANRGAANGSVLPPTS